MVLSRYDTLEITRVNGAFDIKHEWKNLCFVHKPKTYSGILIIFTGTPNMTSSSPTTAPNSNTTAPPAKTAAPTTTTTTTVTTATTCWIHHLQIYNWAAMVESLPLK